MAQRTTLNISLPREMRKQVEQVAKVEHRTTSELVREALRYYFTRPLRMEMPTPAERRAIERGRRAYAHGETITLADYLRELESRTRKARKKTA